MAPPKRSLVNFNERVLCLITCSVHVNRHTGLLDWADDDDFDQTLRAPSKNSAQLHLQNPIANL